MAGIINIAPGDEYLIPYGYYPENITVKSAKLSTLTPGTATAANILKGKTAWVNGVKITGTATSFDATPTGTKKELIGTEFWTANTNGLLTGGEKKFLTTNTLVGINLGINFVLTPSNTSLNQRWESAMQFKTALDTPFYLDYNLIGTHDGSIYKIRVGFGRCVDGLYLSLHADVSLVTAAPSVQYNSNYYYTMYVYRIVPTV